MPTLNDKAVLVLHADLESYDSATRGSHFACALHFDPHAYRITDEDRPAKLPLEAEESECRAVDHSKASREPGSDGSAEHAVRYPLAEGGVSGENLIGMKRVVIAGQTGERSYIMFGDGSPWADGVVTGLEILEVPAEKPLAWHVEPPSWKQPAKRAIVATVQSAGNGSMLERTRRSSARSRHWSERCGTRLNLALRLCMLICALVLITACQDRGLQQPVQPREALSEPGGGDRDRVLPRYRAVGAAGAIHFDAHCTACHGVGGSGDGPLGRTLRPAPPDLTDSGAVADSSPARYFDAISVGVMGSSMKRFDHVLDEDERWDTAFHLWSLAATESDFAAGASAYDESCSGCHGADGRSVIAAPLDRPERALDSRRDLAKKVEVAHVGLVLAMTENSRSALIEHLYTFLYSPTTAGSVRESDE